MKQLLLSVFVLVLTAGVSAAQTPAAGHIGLYNDQAGTSCNIIDAAPGLKLVYVLHVGSVAVNGVTASEFSAPMPTTCGAGTATFLSDGQVFPVTVGSSQGDVSIGYGSCRAVPLHILTINLFASGTTPACCVWDVVPGNAVASGEIEVVNCTGQLLVGSGIRSTINGNASCPCGTVLIGGVPAENHSWGAIKSLYTE